MPKLYRVLRDAELVGRLDAVDCVAASVGQTQDLRLAALRLQQERREVARRQRVLDRADDTSAGGLHDVGGVVLQLRAEGVVGGQEVPGLAAALDHRATSALGQCDGVVGPGHGVGRALLVGQCRGAGAVVEQVATVTMR